jgi:hypothetical protein
LYRKYQKKTEILNDGYDKPMLDRLGNTDFADDIVKRFNTFYSIIKSGVAERAVCFDFLAGVTKITATSIFSGGNDVTDISPDPRFSDVCGFTDDEIHRHYAKHLESLIPMDDASGDRISDLDSLISEIRRKYDGYSWGDGTDRVMNPFSLIKLMETGRFSNFWFNSGTPAFLLKLLSRDPNQASDILLEREHVLTVDEFNAVSVSNAQVIPLLLQAGYFTTERREDNTLFLGVPNTEVRTAISSLSFNLIAGQQNS